MTPPRPTAQQIADALRDPNSDPHETWAMWQALPVPERGSDPRLVLALVPELEEES